MPTWGLVAAKVLSVEEARTELIKLGYDIEASSQGLIAEQSALAEATDTFGARMKQELGAEDAPDDQPQEAPLP